jgi:2-polyprenyl-6-methoxyphenol hydroxylase-like FAD-dependent oxidoreductase
MHPEILVAGGGIGGLSAALALARCGRRVRVLEKAAEFGEIGYGIQMGPNVYPILGQLGVFKAMEPHVVYPEALVMADAISGEELTRISLGPAFRKRYTHPYFVIHRRDLHGGILEACRTHDAITLEASKGLAKLRQEGERVLVTCEDGSECEGAALIGADGLWSPTRGQVVADGPPHLTGHVVYRGVVPTDEVIDRSYLNSMVIYVGRNMHLVQYRLRAGTVMNNVATIESDRFKRGDPKFGGPDELEEIFAQCAPRVRDMLRYVSRERNWVLHDRDPVTNWTKGNVTLLGDAAHPTLQYLAQGACMAIEDAIVLAAEVARHGENYNAAFLAYQQQRMNRTARVVLSARFFGAVCHAGGGARMLRNELLARRSPDEPWEADWLYGGISVPE